MCWNYEEISCVCVYGGQKLPEKILTIRRKLTKTKGKRVEMKILGIYIYFFAINIEIKSGQKCIHAHTQTRIESVARQNMITHTQNISTHKQT